MRAIKGLLGAAALATALLVSGCGATTSTQPVNLTDPAQLNQLCGTRAHDVANDVTKIDETAPAGSGKRNELSTKYGMDPNNAQQIADIRAKLAKLPDQCPTGTASPSPTTSASPSASTGGMTGGNTSVANKDGQRQTMPFLADGTFPNGNTTGAAQMPPLSGALAIDCGTLNGWDQLVPCIDKSGTAGQKYAAQVDKMHSEGNLTFTWSDVQKWATAKTKEGKLPEARVIQVFGYSQAEMPADQARANIADLVGGKDVAANLQVVYKEASFIDTLRPKFKDNETTDIQEFVDFNKQVRVSLVPLVLDNSGAAIGIDGNSDSGVFVDCYNIHGKAVFMPVKPGEELKCQPGTEMAGQPLPENGVCNTPHQECTSNCGGTTCTANCGNATCTSNCGGTPPPCANDCLAAKHPALDPAPRGNAGNGGGVNADPGPGTYIPPAQMQQPPAAPRQNPAPPAPQPAPVQDSGGNTIPAPNPNPVNTPRPTAPPEPAAPAPSQAPTTCVPAPGMTSC